MKKATNKKAKNISKKKLESSKSDSRIGVKTYTADDMIFIAQKFMTLGLNVQSVVQVMKEQNIYEAFANNPQMQIELQKLFKEKEKLVDLVDCLQKINTVEKIQVAISNLNIFQMSLLEKLK